uniref:Nuclear pore complex protein Nup85 n=1 Tax=Macrostomum lignano TaxID=282301 RepID=A0A1I8I976_9PLAT
MLRLANNGFAKHFGWLKHGHQLLPVPSTFQALSRRSILSASFSCPDAWQSRLSAHDAVSGLDLGNGLLRALDRREPVAPVDVDIYANKLDSFELSYLPYFSNVLAKFRVTQESLGKLESTDHALVRCMISLGQAELLVDWLRDKFTYGIFLDQFSASLLIDHLYEAGDARLAALVAFDHALQDLPSDGWPCTGLMLLASISRAANQLSEWTTAVSADANADGEEAAEEDDEDDDSPDTQHVIVDYIRRPNYDNYFDIEEERLQVGLTLARVGRRLLAEWPGQPAGLACLLIGLAAWEKPDELLSVLRQQQLPAVSESTLLVVDSLLGSARCLGNGKAPSAEESWHAELFAVAHRLVAEHEAKSASRLAALYAEFARVRLAELRSHGDWLRKRRLFRDVKSRLDDLVGEQ